MQLNPANSTTGIVYLGGADGFKPPKKNVAAEIEKSGINLLFYRSFSMRPQKVFIPWEAIKKIETEEQPNKKAEQKRWLAATLIGSFYGGAIGAGLFGSLVAFMKDGVILIQYQLEGEDLQTLVLATTSFDQIRERIEKRSGKTFK